MNAAAAQVMQVLDRYLQTTPTGGPLTGAVAAAVAAARTDPELHDALTVLLTGGPTDLAQLTAIRTAVTYLHNSDGNTQALRQVAAGQASSSDPIALICRRCEAAAQLCGEDHPEAAGLLATALLAAVLIEWSSLGTPGARRIRNGTGHQDAAAVLRWCNYLAGRPAEPESANGSSEASEDEAQDFADWPSAVVAGWSTSLSSAATTEDATTGPELAAEAPLSQDPGQGRLENPQHQPGMRRPAQTARLGGNRECAAEERERAMFSREATERRPTEAQVSSVHTRDSSAGRVGRMLAGVREGGQVSRTTRAEILGLAALALLGTAGGSVFGALASEGGEEPLRNIILGVVCAIVLVSVTAINRYIDIRFLRAGGMARERAFAARECAALSKEGAERQAAEVQDDAETRVIIGLRARLSPVLYCLGKIAAAPSGTVEAPLIGSLTQASVAAAVEQREHDDFRRSIFFAVKGDVMECACYAGYEGQQDAGRSIFSNRPDDPVGQYMFRLLGEREALLIRDLDAADLTVKFPPRRSYQTIIAVAVMAGESPAGILTLDAAQPDSLGQPDLEIMKTLASLLGVGLALGAHTNMPRLQVPAQSNLELP